jgi:hypothetical protein
VVEKQGQAVVIEWQEEGESRRCILPKQLLVKYKANLPIEVLRQGIPYGMEWADLLADMVSPTPEDVERELHKVGIWTEAQLRANVAGTRRAIDAAFGNLLVQLLRRAKARCRAS